MAIVIGLIILVFSAILHEIAHGYVADRLGDPTARLAGRLTLDPRKHIDPIMSILVPLTLLIGSGGHFAFGGAKPVPVDTFNLKDGRKDVALVSLAGPLTNIGIAIIMSLLIKIFFPHPILTSSLLPTILYQIFLLTAELNISLAIFNLLPIPPLDGSKIFALILPEKEAQAYLSIGNIGTFILLFLLFFPIGGFSLQNFLFSIITFTENFLGI